MGFLKINHTESKLSSLESRANSLLEFHGLKQRGWKFRFDSALRRYGLCSYSEKTISVSRELAKLNSFEESEQTILHEVAHALTPGHSHNNIWLSKARELGYNGERCYNPSEIHTPEKKRIATCPNCNRSFKYHRIRETLGCKSCKIQTGTFFRFAWS